MENAACCQSTDMISLLLFIYLFIMKSYMSTQKNAKKKKNKQTADNWTTTHTTIQ